jgi:predicted NUDIX family NTP pyrophosphohydrolase
VKKESSGTLLYRRQKNTVEVLIVCPSGPAARYGWSIPKGLPDANETLEEAARRETREETGCDAGELKYLGYIDYKKSQKRVHCFHGRAGDVTPKVASWEISSARFVPIDEAQDLLHEDQRSLIDMLMAAIKEPG